MNPFIQTSIDPNSAETITSYGQTGKQIRPIHSDQFSCFYAPIKILLIDDSETDRATYIRYLQTDPDHRYHISSVDNLEEAIALWPSQSSDMVLLDMDLPDGDGFEFLELLQQNRIKQNFRLNVPIIVLSGKGNEQIAIRAIKLGAVDYLNKDHITATSLRQTILAAIDYRDVA